MDFFHSAPIRHLRLRWKEQVPFRDANLVGNLAHQANLHRYFLGIAGRLLFDGWHIWQAT